MTNQAFEEYLIVHVWIFIVFRCIICFETTVLIIKLSVILFLSHINISIFPKLHILAQFGPLYCIVLYCIDILMYYTAVS